MLAVCVFGGFSPPIRTSSLSGRPGVSQRFLLGTFRQLFSSRSEFSFDGYAVLPVGPHFLFLAELTRDASNNKLKRLKNSKAWNQINDCVNDLCLFNLN